MVPVNSKTNGDAQPGVVNAEAINNTQNPNAFLTDIIYNTPQKRCFQSLNSCVKLLSDNLKEEDDAINRAWIKLFEKGLGISPPGSQRNAI